MSFYGEMDGVADELLAEFGVPLTVTYVATGSYDTSTGGASTTTAAATVSGYVEDYADRDIDGSRILTGDRRVYLSVRDTAGAAIAKPGPSDKITADGVQYSVVNSKAIPGAGEASLYDVQIRN